MIRIFVLFYLVFSLVMSAPVLAQEKNSPIGGGTPEMADAMRAEGKIYVIVAIILIVLAGVFIYLFLLDRKVKRLETLLREKQGQTK